MRMSSNTVSQFPGYKSSMYRIKGDRMIQLTALSLQHLPDIDGHGAM